MSQILPGCIGMGIGIAGFGLAPGLTQRLIEGKKVKLKFFID